MDNNSGSGVRVFLFAFSVLLGGVLFPFRGSLSPHIFQLAILPLTFLYLSSVFLYFSPEKLGKGIHNRLINVKFESSILFFSIVAFSLMGILMMGYENRMFEQFGYDISFSYLVVLFLFILIIAVILRGYKKGKLLPYALIVSVFSLHLASILNFPIHPERSDMLLLVQAASRQLTSGNNPYICYDIFNPVMLTYLPGMWLTYLPAVLLKVDLRLINLILLTSSAFFFIKSTDPCSRYRYSVYATIFFLNPWLTFRHDIYIPVFIFQMTLALGLYMRKNTIGSMIVFSWVLASYQFSWIVYPLFLMLLWREHGKTAAVKASLVALAGFIILVLPFVLWSPSGFYNGVFGSWKTVFQIETFNFSYWILQILPIQYIKPLQIILLLCFYGYAVPKIRNSNHFLKYATGATLLFMLTGQLIWHYFFLMPPIYMLFYQWTSSVNPE